MKIIKKLYREENKTYMKKEIEKIEEFIKSYVLENERVLILVSGGIDSDVVARLCYKALGKDRIKLLFVKETETEARFVKNVKNLAEDLAVPLTIVPFEGKSMEFIKILEQVENEPIFNSKLILDPAKAKCSMRSAIISSYQDKGLIIAGCTNLTEYELGFFMTFGDNLAHFKPIEHLYKTEIIQLAKEIGTRKEVIDQPATSGFWRKQEDLEDIAFWIFNQGPIMKARKFSKEEKEEIFKIKDQLTWKKIDNCLKGLRNKETIEEIAKETKFSTKIIEGIIQITKKAKQYRNREIMVSMRKEK